MLEFNAGALEGDTICVLVGIVDDMVRISTSTLYFQIYKSSIKSDLSGLCKENVIQNVRPRKVKFVKSISIFHE